MKLKNSDYSFLSAKSLILESRFPKIDNLKSYLSLSSELFIENVKKSYDIDIESNNFDEILEEDWKKTLNKFQRVVNIESLIKYFDIEKEYEKKEIDSNSLFEYEKEKLKKELNTLNFSRFFIEFIKIKIDLFNVLNFLKHKKFELPFKYIKNGNINERIFKEYEKASIENFIDFINSRFPKLIEKGIIDFTELFDKKRDEILIDYLKRSKYFVFGPEIVFSFLSLKNFNNINLRLIYNGIIYNLPYDSVLRRLRNING